ncbi:hypothetical protein GIS00_09455 [Nakamurella sp. YIM 132087]|uniref:Activator of Hsp90 ATPase homologue 1/2-like C-terminal domain-containing protein n=1 Tax=Nakamurella alba TaxID=2665158 RepID=A0A7K1FJC4_9ACTN|nr:SRPBCC family protein [Nakamurella alba]MTD14170.1 hypothetical protein [Nakamurella alba]
MSTTTGTTITAQPGTQQIVMTREFDAPRELVRRAYSEPDLLTRWLGPDDLVMKVEEFDLRHGGSWRYSHTAPDGTAYIFRGTFHGDPTPDGFTQTFEYLGWPGHVALERVDFVDIGDGRTRVETLSVYQSVEDRDGMIASGMEDGVVAGYRKLDALLADLA